MLGLDQIQGFLGRGRRLDVVPPLPDEPGQAFALGGLVVDDENLSGLHVIAPAGTHRYRLPSLSPRLIRSCVRCLERRGGAAGTISGSLPRGVSGPLTASGPGDC